MELISLLSTLHTAQSPIRFKQTEIHDLIQTAVELRDDLTREYGIYVWCWVQADSAIEPNSKKVDVEGVFGGDVFPLCLFPGLCRKFKNARGVIEEVVVSQVMVEMEKIHSVC